MTPTELLRVFQEFDDKLQFADFFSDIIRNLLWGLIKFLIWLTSGAEHVYLEIYKFLGFLNTEGFGQFISQHRILAFSIGTLSATLFLFRYMKEPNLRLRSLFDTILIGLSIILLMSVGLQKTGEFIQNYAVAVKNNHQEITYKLVNENMYDLDIYNQENWSNPSTSLYSKRSADGSLILTKDNISFLDFNERMWDSKSGLTETTKKVLTQKKSLIYTVDNQTLVPTPVTVDKGGGFFGLGKPEYYRYQVNFSVIFLLAMMGMVFVLCAFKTGSMIWQIINTAIITVAVVFTDVEDNQKVRKGIKNIVSYIIHLLFVPITIQLYGQGISYLNTLSLSLLAYLILFFVLSFGVLEGSYYLQEITGIDAGIGSMAQKLQGLYYSSQMFKGFVAGGKNLFSGAKNAASTISKKGVSAAGGVQGFFEGVKDSVKMADNLENTGVTADGFSGKTLEEEKNSRHKDNQDNVDNLQMHTDKLPGDNPDVNSPYEQNNVDIFNPEQMDDRDTITPNHQTLELLKNADELDNYREMRKKENRIAPVDSYRVGGKDVPNVTLPQYHGSKEQLNKAIEKTQLEKAEDNKTLSTYTKEKASQLSDKAIDSYINKMSGQTMKNYDNNRMVGRKVGRLTGGLFNKAKNKMIGKGRKK